MWKACTRQHGVDIFLCVFGLKVFSAFISCGRWDTLEDNVLKPKIHVHMHVEITGNHVRPCFSVVLHISETGKIYICLKIGPLVMVTVLSFLASCVLVETSLAVYLPAAKRPIVTACSFCNRKHRKSPSEHSQLFSCNSDYITLLILNNFYSEHT